MVINDRAAEGVEVEEQVAGLRVLLASKWLYVRPVEILPGLSLELSLIRPGPTAGEWVPRAQHYSWIRLTIIRARASFPLYADDRNFF